MNLTATIVVPTYNAEKYLSSLLKVLVLTKEKYGIDSLFVDSSSTDNTVKLINTESDFRVISIPTIEFDHGGTRSLSVNYIDTDLVIYLTQDALPIDEKMFEILISNFKDEQVAISFGRQAPYPETSLFGKHLREYNYPAVSYSRSLKDVSKLGFKTGFVSNSFAAYRVASMNEIGWFKKGLILGEDAYAGSRLLKLGYKINYVSNAVVMHSHSYSIVQDFRRYFDTGVFHQMENWILADFGKPEGEGSRFVRSELNYLIQNNAYHLIPEFFVRNAFRFLGYKLGKNFEKLPRFLIKKFSMHYRWWKY